jgi:hypothetical protein
VKGERRSLHLDNKSKGGGGKIPWGHQNQWRLKGWRVGFLQKFVKFFFPRFKLLHTGKKG